MISSIGCDACGKEMQKVGGAPSNDIRTLNFWCSNCGTLAHVQVVPPKQQANEQKTVAIFCVVNSAAGFGRKVLMENRPDFVHPIRADPYWVYPGGQVEPGETAQGAAIREMLEETGVRSIRIEQLGEPFKGGNGWIDIPFIVTQWSGDIPSQTDRGDRLEWFGIDEIAKLDKDEHSGRVEIARRLEGYFATH